MKYKVVADLRFKGFKAIVRVVLLVYEDAQVLLGIDVVTVFLQFPHMIINE